MTKPASPVTIFDTTLRDGEQAPGYSMTEAGKLSVARALQALKVDVIEAGFAAASPGDFRAVERIAREIDGPAICSLARSTPGDIEAAARALKDAPRKRLHIFLGTSPLHREFKLNMTPDQVLTRIKEMTELAREHFDDVEFSSFSRRSSTLNIDFAISRIRSMAVPQSLASFSRSTLALSSLSS